MRRVVVIPFVGVGSEEYLSQSIYDTGYHIKKVGCIIFLHFDYLSWYSVGLPRVSKQNFKLVCLNAKPPNKGIPVDLSPFYGTLNENKLLKAPQNQEEDTDIPFTVTAAISCCEIY